MKLITSLSAGLLSVGLLVSASAQSDPIKFELPPVGSGANQPKAAPAQQPAPKAAPQQQQPAAAAPVKFTEDQLMEVYGWVLGERMNLVSLEFTPANVDAMARGMKLLLSGRQPTYDAPQIGEQLQEFLGRKQQALMLKIRNQNLAATAEFFTKLKENTAVKELPGSNGLRYEVFTEGKGPVAKEGQLVTMHYTGAFINGQIFDSSMRAAEGETPQPVDALVQAGALIEGMELALKKMPVGSKWRLYIPPHLAYGDEGVPQIGVPPAAAMIFDVEVLGVKDAPKESAQPKK